MRSIHAIAEDAVADVVLSLQGLGVTFTTPAGEVAAVRELSLTVARGECVGVVGESGAGKSQAFLAAMGLLAGNGRATGRVMFGGRDGVSGRATGGTDGKRKTVDLLTLGGAALDRVRGSRIGMVFQDPMTSLTPHIPVGDQVAEPMVRHLGLTWREARARALALLEQVHSSDAPRRMAQFPHELSGGMRQRVMIAIALACDPELLIADEPTTSLDVTIQAQILALLLELKRARGMAMVLITHDFGAVAGLADRVAVMHSGRIVELNTVGAVMNTPRDPYTRGLLRTLARGENAADSPGTPAAPGTAGARPLAPAGSPTLSLSHLRVQFPVSQGWFSRPAMLRAVEDVSFDLYPGEALGVVGESGSGKSTLARAVVRLLRPESGEVVWLGKAVQGLSAAALRPLRRDLQIVFQDPLASLDPRMTVAEIVAEPLRVHRPGLGAAERAQAVADMLVRVGLGAEAMARFPHEFSGGQCQRIGIARAMILEPRLLVCDEPVSGLDVALQEQILTLLADLKREFGTSILFVSHNLAAVRRLCDRVLVLYMGRMLELARVGKLEGPLPGGPRHPYTRELLEAVPVADPDLQPARLERVSGGEPPSPLNPPSGCVYRTRCPYAVAVCSTEVPAWEEEAETAHGVACYRWREVARSMS